MRFLKIVMLSLFRAKLIAFKITIANVTVFIPPAVEPGDVKSGSGFG